MKHRILIALTIAVFGAMGTVAQEVDTEVDAEEVPASRISVGAAAGLRANFMRYSELNKSIYPHNRATLGTSIGVFGEIEWGKELHWGLRPELNFTRRGGKLTDVRNDMLSAGLNDYTYSAAVTYFDLRVPVLLHFGKVCSTWRPYIYAGPALGFASAGRFKVVGNDAGKEASYKVNATGDNVAKARLGLEFGVGVKYNFNITEKMKAYVGVEMAYDWGLTDTYSGAEKNGNAQVNNDYFGNNYSVRGSRKFSGMEVRFTFGLPLKGFGKQRKSPKPELVEEDRMPVRVETNATERTTNAFAGTNCFSLDEIIEMMAQGSSVEGKTICSVDDINFDFNSSEIREDSYAYLDKLAATLVRMNASVEVKGHTDNVGTDEVNMRISRQRAQAVMEYLIGQGVNASRICYSYYGASRPLVSNETVEGRRINRRVEVEILR